MEIHGTGRKNAFFQLEEIDRVPNAKIISLFSREPTTLSTHSVYSQCRDLGRHYGNGNILLEVNKIMGEPEQKK